MINVTSEPVDFETVVRRNVIPAKASILNNSRDPEKTTEKYVETDDLGVVQVLNNNGWFIDNYQQMGTHNIEKALYKPYMATYRNPNLKPIGEEGELTILQRGSKDGTKKFIIDAGFFKFACLNGLVLGNRLFKPVGIKHIGSVPDQLGEVLEQINKAIPFVYDTVVDMSKVTLTQNQQYEFARKALGFRFKEDKQGVTVEDVLKARRVEDHGDSLWKVLNRVQENLIKGGSFRYTSKNNRIRSSRAVTNIDLQYNINTALWDLADSYLVN